MNKKNQYTTELVPTSQRGQSIFVARTPDDPAHHVAHVQVQMPTEFATYVKGLIDADQAKRSRSATIKPPRRTKYQNSRDEIESVATIELLMGEFKIGQEQAQEVLDAIPDWDKMGWNALKYEARLALR